MQKRLDTAFWNGDIVDVTDLLTKDKPTIQEAMVIGYMENMEIVRLLQEPQEINTIKPLFKNTFVRSCWVEL